MRIFLGLFYFFYFAIVGVYIIFLPKVLAQSGYSGSEIGIIFAAGPMVRFILPFLLMKGLKLNKQNFNVALGIMLISSLSFFFSLESFYKLLASNIALGIGMSLVLPYIELIALRSVGGARYGKIRLFGSVGFILVALVLVKFLSSSVVALSFLVALTFLTSIFAFIIVKNVNKVCNEKEVSKNDIDLIGDWKLWVGLTLMQVSFGSFYNFFTIYETDYGVSLDMTIYLWTFGVLAEITMLFSQGKLLRGDLLQMLQITAFVTAFRWFLVFAFAQNLAVMFFAQMLHALSFALFHTAAISYLFRIYKHKALAQQFFSGITYGFGGFSGALIAGYIYEFYPTYLFLSSAFIALLAWGFLSLFARKINFHSLNKTLFGSRH